MTSPFEDLYLKQKRRCAIKECKMSSIVFWTPVLKIWAKGRKKIKDQACEMRMGIFYCDDCKNAQEQKSHADFLTDWFPAENRARISNSFLSGGLAEPDFDGAEMKWERK